jgi:hypothetical protein
VVISESLADTMNWKVGEVIQLRDTPFRVVGMVAFSTDVLQAEAEVSALAPAQSVVWVPLTVPPYWLSLAGPPETELEALFVRVFPMARTWNRLVARCPAS